MTYSDRDVQTMVHAYLDTALWLASDAEGEPLHATAEDLAGEAEASAWDDVDDFVAAAGDLLDGVDPEAAGHDFFLTRNRHGAGFWDRGLGEVGDKLTELAHPYGEAALCVGDDGRLYF